MMMRLLEILKVLKKVTGIKILNICSHCYILFFHCPFYILWKFIKVLVVKEWRKFLFFNSVKFLIMNFLLFLLCALFKDFFSFDWLIRYISSITALYYTLPYIICIFPMRTSFWILIVNNLRLSVIRWSSKLYGDYYLVLDFWVLKFILLL